ncbi:molt-inhibiting hormone isoform X2 [Temnothorax curvispinosus]|uniref:Molt-inhibiting hormone isoform X2 n=1 Tax=Temnothorax curvispinosus TaxID=300111 RepID=A0A6J1QWJ9_9HYME|nr:molt-inhibiting hormone isoform X2 [Temnothorax curvispinosus]
MRRDARIRRTLDTIERSGSRNNSCVTIGRPSVRRKDLDMMMHQQQTTQSSSNDDFAMYPSAAYHSSCSTLLSSTSTSTSTSSSSRSSSARSSCSLLVSVLTWSLTLLLISSCIGLGADAATLNGHFLGKRSFFDIQCKGVYDKSIFARLDRICEDCYNLFREPQLHMLCKQDCFSTQYFTSCIQALLLEDEKERFQEMVEYLGRKK